MNPNQNFELKILRLIYKPDQHVCHCSHYKCSFISVHIAIYKALLYVWSLYIYIYIYIYIISKFFYNSNFMNIASPTK